MTDNSINKTRSKLTLKMPSSVSASSTTAKSTEKRIGNSSIQVTIKGRKKDPSKTRESVDLNRVEIEQRIKAISQSEEVTKAEIKTSDILKAATKEKLAPEKLAPKAKEEVVEVVVEKNVEKPVKKSTKKTTEETPLEKKPSNPAITLEKAKPANPSYGLDEFDVRNKIKNSVAIANREKEARDKALESKRSEEEKVRVEKETVEKEKKKVKKALTPVKNFSEDNSAKKKSNFKGGKGHSRKMTYIVGSDDDGSGRRRKRGRVKQQIDSKDYKKIIKEVALPDLITVADLAERMAEKTGDVVKKLFSMGMVTTSNQAIDAETAEIIIDEFGHTSKRVSHSDVESVFESNNNNEKLPRAPIVTIMGHVDHGKTSLLDAMRRTDVVAGEAGGITQHIGASNIKTADGQYITFLDTPGHEAFSEMRSRGANITDIVVLVVAADDGVKAQTIEAINHAKAAGVPIIVAVNKIDKPEADPARVKNELLNHEIIAEELGGDVMFVSVSAKAKTNLDKLEEAILLQAEILDLKAPYEGASNGVVVESRVDPSRGVVATLLVQEGTLSTSDLIVVGTSFGRVRRMTDDNKKEVKHATPSIAVEVLGLDSAPNAGDRFTEVSEERQAREIITYRQRQEREIKALQNSAKSFDDILKKSGSGNLKYLNILIKGDVHGSVEAIAGSIVKLNTEEVAIKIVHSATGAISESDISLAAASGAIIVGFNVRTGSQARDMAKEKSVDIRYYSIIYNLVDDLKLLLSGMLTPTINEVYLGQAEIRQVFKISSSGKIAGCFVTDGVIKRQARARLLRDNVVIHEGTLKTLKRFKDDVKEVKNGFECGVAFESYEDIKEKDSIECFEIVEHKRSL
jgi:translation initiation factor IF-2